MKLENLLSSLEGRNLSGTNQKEILGISDDSRKIKKDYLFVAIPGLTVDGHDFVDKAIANGAIAVVGEKNLTLNENVTYIKVPNSRKALALLASEWFGNPSRKMKVVGVTGTDGKTTTTNIIYWILRAAGKKVGLISTINAVIGDKKYDTGLHVTSPEPIALQEFLKEMAAKGTEYAILETTSHGLDQDRFAGIEFEVGAITNITHEHLDYHKTWEDYRNAKARLFQGVKLAVLNKDDESFETLKSKITSPIQTYSINSEADLTARDIKQAEHGMEFLINDGEKDIKITTSLMGDYNVSNILAAVSAVRYFGVPWEVVAKALKTFSSPVGRQERIENDKGLEIYVDFAHTPNSLKNILTLLDKKKKGKLISVFGCVGERDKEKRPMMGEVSTRLADISIFTADDPRHENLDDIFAAMVKGALKTGARQGLGEGRRFLVVPERGEAIYKAINELAKPGDTIAVCSKGHERSLAYGDIEYPWSDQEAVREALEGRIKERKLP